MGKSRSTQGAIVVEDSAHDPCLPSASVRFCVSVIAHWSVRHWVNWVTEMVWMVYMCVPSITTTWVCLCLSMCVTTMNQNRHPASHSKCDTGWRLY
jgi:hypothetical protein